MCLGNILIRDVLELLRSTDESDEFLSDLVGKLDCRDKVAYTKTEAHRDSSTALLLVHKKR
jgi:hypothetical protein